MPIRTIIIDDSPDWRDVLSRFVKFTPILQLVGAFESAFTAYPHITAGEVDLILIDIEMPDINGIKFIQSLDNPPIVVFVTSHPQFAVAGFDAAATDYLVKPFEVDRFLKCIERVRIRLEAYKALKAGHQDQEDDYFFIKVNQNTVKLRYNDVLYLKSMENYVQVQTTSGESMLTVSGLNSFEKRLPPSVFVRCHRSYLVNIRFLSTINNNTLTLKQGQEIPIGERYYDKIHRDYVHKKMIRRD
ncbi:MAG: response regulator transcription factor [Saprospiraceae bacterium]|nr:response regulator transcription factor [Saprospiraceae bacterium]